MDWIGLGQILYRVGSEFSQYIMGCVGLGYVCSLNLGTTVSPWLPACRNSCEKWAYHLSREINDNYNEWFTDWRKQLSWQDYHRKPSETRH